MSSDTPTQLRFGTSPESFEFTFNLPAHSSSSPTLHMTSPYTPSSSTISHLPPEIIAHAFDQFRLYSSFERNSTLASLCLVNRCFRDIARPLLYRELVFYPRGLEKRKRANLDSLLMENGECSNLVRSLKFPLGGLKSEDIVKISRIMVNLGRLDTIRMNWSQSRPSEAVMNDFLTVIRRYGKQIVSLELPWVAVPRQVIASFPNLRTFVGASLLSDSSSPSKAYFRSSSQIQRLVLSFPLTQTIFSTSVQPLENTLTSLGIVFDADTGGIDLSTFQHLTTLRLVVADIKYLVSVSWANFSTFGVLSPSPEVLPTLAVNQLRETLLSAQSLTIRNFTLAATNGKVVDLLVKLSLFGLLPRSLSNLSTFPQMLLPNETLNTSVFLDSVKNGALPHLNSITLLPYSLTGNETEWKLEMMRNEVETFCRRNGIEVHVEATGLPEKVNWGLALDPWGQELKSQRRYNPGRDEENSSDGENDEEEEEEEESVRRSYWRRLVVGTCGHLKRLFRM